MLVWRERQNLAEFLHRVRDRQATWESGRRREWADHLRQLAGWIERVTVQVNPQVPAYFIALPHPVSRLLGGFYHPSLLMLRIPPRQRLRSLMVGDGDTAGS